MQSSILGGPNGSPRGVHVHCRSLDSEVCPLGNIAPLYIKVPEIPPQVAVGSAEHVGSLRMRTQWLFFIRIDCDPSAVLPFYLFTCT